MKTTFAFLICLALSMTAFAKDINPADYPLTAHILKSGRQGGASSAYASGILFRDAVQYETTIQIGNLVYSAPRRACEELSVGSDYPAKLNGNDLKVLSGYLTGHNKVCSFKIVGTAEATK